MWSAAFDPGLSDQNIQMTAEKNSKTLTENWKTDTKEYFCLPIKIILKLAYLKDSNAAAHSVDSEIFQSSDSSVRCVIAEN